MQDRSHDLVYFSAEKESISAFSLSVRIVSFWNLHVEQCRPSIGFAAKSVVGWSPLSKFCLGLAVQDLSRVFWRRVRT